MLKKGLKILKMLLIGYYVSNYMLMTFALSNIVADKYFEEHEFDERPTFDKISKFTYKMVWGEFKKFFKR